MSSLFEGLGFFSPDCSLQDYIRGHDPEVMKTTTQTQQLKLKIPITTTTSPNDTKDNSNSSDKPGVKVESLNIDYTQILAASTISNHNSSDDDANNDYNLNNSVTCYGVDTLDNTSSVEMTKNKQLQCHQYELSLGCVLRALSGLKMDMSHRVRLILLRIRCFAILLHNSSFTS